MQTHDVLLVQIDALKDVDLAGIWPHRPKSPNCACQHEFPVSSLAMLTRWPSTTNPDRDMLEVADEKSMRPRLLGSNTDTGSSCTNDRLLRVIVRYGID